MPKTYEQYMAESGQQSTLDQLNASGGYDAAKNIWESGSGATPAIAPTANSSYSTANTAGSSPSSFTPTKTFDQFMAESGRQSELDSIRAIPGNYEIELAKYNSGGYAGSSSTSSTSGAMTGFEAPAPINLSETYQGLYDSSGISDLEAQYSTQEKSYIEAKGKINDNPFLSEATRVGRIAKIESLFAERTANIKGDIATQKADVETQMNLKLQQLDINSQQTQLAWQQLGSLLDMGALDNANGEDIANWTRQTGISSTMIKSAIAERNKPEPVQTSMVQSTNDAGEMTVSVINSQTGEVISQQSLGAIGKATKVTGGGSTTTSTKNAQQQFTSDAESTQGVSTDAGWVGIFPQLVAKYAAFMSLNDIYKLYLNSATGQKYGTPNESASEIKEIYDAYRGS